MHNGRGYTALDRCDTCRELIITWGGRWEHLDVSILGHEPYPTHSQPSKPPQRRPWLPDALVAISLTVAMIGVVIVAIVAL
jgi:hypothetical protein